MRRDESRVDDLGHARRFLMALASRDPLSASAELAPDATYHVPGDNAFAGSFAGRREIVQHFDRMFSFASGSEALKWVDWMLGTNLVAVLVQSKLEHGYLQFQGRLLFVISSDAEGGIGDIRLFLEDQSRFDRFFSQSEVEHEST